MDRSRKHAASKSKNSDQVNKCRSGSGRNGIDTHQNTVAVYRDPNFDLRSRGRGWFSGIKQVFSAGYLSPFIGNGY